MVQETEKQITDEEKNDYTIFKMLTDTEKHKVMYLAKKKELTLYKTQYGRLINTQELIYALSKSKIQNVPRSSGYSIDLSTSSKINCLYRRVANMNKQNRDHILKDHSLTRYVDECGYMCINLKEYLKPQIRLIAKKLEVKESMVVSALYDELHKQYLKDKEKEE